MRLQRPQPYPTRRGPRALKLWGLTSTLFFAALLSAQPARAAEPAPDTETADLLRISPALGEPSAAKFCVAQIELRGLENTRASVLERELRLDGVEAGAQITRSQIEEAVQRVRNMGIFRKVRARLSPAHLDADAGCEHAQPARLELSVDEQWTALPLFNYSQGGGTFRLRLGAYDENFLGRFLSVGAQYERLGDTNSAFAWASNPRLFGQRLLGRVSVGQRNRLYHLYEPEGDLSGGFLLRRFLAEAYLRKEWLPWLRSGALIHFDHDDFSLELLGDELREKQRARGLPDTNHALFFGLDAMIGRFNLDNYLIQGARGYLALNHAQAGLGSTYTFTELSAAFSFFETLPFKSTLGLHLGAGLSRGGEDNPQALHRRYYLGGLDAVRGFQSDRFSGAHFWLASAELRIPSLDSRWLVVQHIGFIDAAGTAESLGGLAQLSGASAGVGLRIIVPKIKDFIVRVDYAFGLYGEAPNPLSMGGGQFF